MKQEIFKGIDFEVQQYPVFAKIEGKMVEVDGKFATVRTDTNEPIGVVGLDYKIQNHKENLSMVSEIVDNISKDWSIQNTYYRGTVFTKFMLKDFLIMKDNKREASNLCLQVINNYNGLKRFEAELSIFRQICKNGAMGYAKEAIIEALHVKGLHIKIIKEKILKMVEDHKQKYVEFYKKLNEVKPIQEEVLIDFFGKRIVKKANEIFLTESDIDGATAWAQYNSFTNIISHADITQFNINDQLKRVSQFFLSKI